MEYYQIMINLYGIPNCDTIRKARQWLNSQGITYEFHDYKKEGLDKKLLQQWVNCLGWEALINRRGTTWRKLDESIKAHIDEASAIQIMLEAPSIIKRPLLDDGKSIYLGFKADDYAKIFVEPAAK
jgi:arsenate reductase (glutaredoxin)